MSHEPGRRGTNGPLYTKQDSKPQGSEVNCSGQHMAQPGPKHSLLEFTSSAHPSEPSSLLTRFKKLCGLGILKCIRTDVITKCHIW